MLRKLALVAAIAVSSLLTVPGTALADKLIVKSGQGAIERPNVKVKSIDGDQLVFDSSTGNETRQPLDAIVKIEITGDAAFNSAEDAFAAEKWSEAADAYTKANRGATKDWQKDRISKRLAELGAKTGRFDVAAGAYVALLARNPEAAGNAKPALPADKAAKELTAVVADIDKALGDAKLEPPKRMALLNYKLEIQNYRGDEKAAADVIEQLLKVNPNDPNLQVTLAMRQLQNREYDKALKAIESQKANITDPDAQANALWILAEANYQQALAAKKSDKTAWQDIAISFMRVVSHFGSSPRAAEALARVGSCYEQMKDTAGAKKAYEQVVRDYGQSAAAKDAKAALDRLKS